MKEVQVQFEAVSEKGGELGTIEYPVLLLISYSLLSYNCVS